MGLQGLNIYSKPFKALGKFFTIVSGIITGGTFQFQNGDDFEFQDGTTYDFN